MKLFLILQLFVLPTAFSAVCSCDAPPECGRSRPPGCKVQEVETVESLLRSLSVKESLSTEAL